MTVIEWLDQGAMMQEVINAKQAEYEQLLAMATKITANNDGMPHATAISDKVGNIGVKLAAKALEIDALLTEYEEYENEVTSALMKLPVNEFGVLHRIYVLGMKWEDVAADMNYSTVQVWRLKIRGEKRLKEIFP